jgi:hypothetical protein
MVSKATRTKTLDTSTFWHIIFPLLSLVILLFVLFVIYTMPDWAITCPAGLQSVRNLASSISK